MFRVNRLHSSSSCLVKLTPSNVPLSLSAFLFSFSGAFIRLLSYTTLCSGLHSSPSNLFRPCFAASSAWVWWLEIFKRDGESGVHLILDLLSSVLFDSKKKVMTWCRPCSFSRNQCLECDSVFLIVIKASNIWLLVVCSWGICGC